MLSVSNAERHTLALYTECHYAECRGAILLALAFFEGCICIKAHKLINTSIAAFAPVRF